MLCPHPDSILAVSNVALIQRGTAVPNTAHRRSATYILRVWSASAMPDGRSQLRFSVERVGDDAQRRGFESFTVLVDYLRTVCGVEGPEDEDTVHMQT